MKKSYIFLLVFMISINLIASNDLLYQYDYDNKIMYSLEGGMSRLYYDESDLDYPGTYYISQYNGDKLMSIEKIKLDNNYKKEYVAKNDNEFINYVKYACENMLPSITIKKRSTISDPQKYLSTYLNRTLDLYPQLAVSGFSASHKYYGGYITFTINFNYYFKSKTEYDKYNSKMNKLIDQILDKAVTQDDPQLFIYNYIIENCRYDSGPYKNTVQGALVDGYANCEGYSKALMMLLNMCGIQNEVVSGKIKDGTLHMWNKVYFREFKDKDTFDSMGNENELNVSIYYCDITFEDTSDNSYYNLSYSPHQIVKLY